MARTAEINRETKETKVRLRLDLEASGDLETGAHHTTEDVGICHGQAIDEALGDRSGIRRYGSALVPMDEALGECAIDISGRPYIAFDADLPEVNIAGFDSRVGGRRSDPWAGIESVRQTLTRTMFQSLRDSHE